MGACLPADHVDRVIADHERHRRTLNALFLVAAFAMVLLVELAIVVIL